VNETLITALQQQANYELFAAHSYEAIAYWCEANEYGGFAAFFYSQAEEEREHSKSFFKHLMDRGIDPELTEIAAPKGDYESLIEIALMAQKMEKNNTDQIIGCFQIARDTKEYRSMPFLEGFIEEQVEEEAWTAKLLTLTERAQCSGAIYSLDRHIVKEMGED
jgi:ferritin